jgi:ornithine cyclodeaminase
MTHDGLLFISYRDTLELFGAEDALDVVENVYGMHARGTVQWSDPMDFRMDVDEFSNHWHVKGCTLKEIPVAGVRMYGYFEDAERSTVGTLDSTRYIVISDPVTSVPLAIVDEHWSFSLRSTAATVVACRWMGPLDRETPLVLGLVGVGSMGRTALMCLSTMYQFSEIRCTSRRPETREAFAAEWSETLATSVVPVASVEECALGADIIVGGTTSTEVVCRADWLKPGATFISLARHELDPRGWAEMDKIVIDDWGFNMLSPYFRQTVEAGNLSRETLHAEIWELVAGTKGGRERADERILIHTTGLVSQDVAIAHWIYERARERGLGTRLPLAHLS